MKAAAALEEQHTIPVIAQQLELIQDIQHDDWWVDVTYRCSNRSAASSGCSYL